MRKILNNKMKLLLLLVLASLCVQAQKKSSRRNSTSDTLSGIRTFIRISNVYQQMPLYLEMEWINSTNFITSSADTSTIKVSFYLKPGMAYIRLEDAEQLINDSMALLVSDKLRRMILYSNAGEVLQRMKSFIGMISGDSSLLQMASKYKAEATFTNEKVAGMKLNGRELMPESVLPKESIELQYYVQTKEPVKVITTRRSLVRISESDYNALKKNSTYNGLLLAPEGKGYFLVKEQVAAFNYKTIKHEADMRLPATIADRLTKNESGELVPVKNYEQYAVTYN